MVTKGAAAPSGDLLSALELPAPVGDYFFEDASVKFARLEMKAST
jgi:hypothetical protein